MTGIPHVSPVSSVARDSIRGNTPNTRKDLTVISHVTGQSKRSPGGDAIIWDPSILYGCIVIFNYANCCTSTCQYCSLFNNYRNRKILSPMSCFSLLFGPTNFLHGVGVPTGNESPETRRRMMGVKIRNQFGVENQNHLHSPSNRLNLHSPTKSSSNASTKPTLHSPISSPAKNFSSPLLGVGRQKVASSSSSSSAPSPSASSSSAANDKDQKNEAIEKEIEKKALDYASRKENCKLDNQLVAPPSLRHQNGSNAAASSPLLRHNYPIAALSPPSSPFRFCNG